MKNNRTDMPRGIVKVLIKTEDPQKYTEVLIKTADLQKYTVVPVFDENGYIEAYEYTITCRTDTL